MPETVWRILIEYDAHAMTGKGNIVLKLLGKMLEITTSKHILGGFQLLETTVWRSPPLSFVAVRVAKYRFRRELAPTTAGRTQGAQSKELRRFNIYKMHSNFSLEF